jgi:GNAT superfamily N-acetyltransferase
MKWSFEKTDFNSLKPSMAARISAFPTIIDGFLVDHIIDSNHYKVLVDGKEAGCFSIHKTSLLTQFHLRNEFSRISQNVFQDVRKMESVQQAFVPTCDACFLAHAMDHFRQIERQAYFFGYDNSRGSIPVDPGFGCRITEESELAFILEKSGDFFNKEELPRYLRNKEAWVAYHNDTFVGFGLIVRSRLFPDVADLGMFVAEEARLKGFGKMIIQTLINTCLARSLKIAAGCWYYNHQSKKTLESAGMHCTARLLKISL